MNNYIFFSNLTIEPNTGLNSIESYIFGSLFLILSLLVFWRAIYINKKIKIIRKNFEIKYQKMNSQEKQKFSKEEYWISNTNWWKRNEFMFWILFFVLLLAISLTFFIGHSFANVL